jgi:hypothetical protein
MFCLELDRRGELVTYLLHISAQRLLTKDIQAFLNRCNGLRSVYIGASADPHSLKSGMLNHLIVGIVDLDSPVFVLVSSPFKL